MQRASIRLPFGLTEGFLPWESGGFTSTPIETGSSMESAVSSSLERLGREGEREGGREGGKW